MEGWDIWHEKREVEARNGWSGWGSCGRREWRVETTHHSIWEDRHGDSGSGRGTARSGTVEMGHCLLPISLLPSPSHSFSLLTLTLTCSLPLFLCLFSMFFFFLHAFLTSLSPFPHHQPLPKKQPHLPCHKTCHLPFLPSPSLSLPPAMPYACLPCRKGNNNNIPDDRKTFMLTTT